MAKLKAEYLANQNNPNRIYNILTEKSLAHLICYNEGTNYGYIIQDITNPQCPHPYASYIYQVDDEGDVCPPTEVRFYSKHN